MILGGLVGATPHMVSASVMAIARLLYEFAPLLEAAAPQLLPVVLSLLRSKSREIVKSVLGFVKVLLVPSFHSGQYFLSLGTFKSCRAVIL